MSGGTTVQTSSSGPWGGYVGDPDFKGDKSWGQQPYLMKGMEGAEDLLKGGLPAYYEGKTLAGFDPAQTAAQQATLGYTMGPRAAGMQRGAEGALASTLARGGQAATYGAGLAGPLSQDKFSQLTPFQQGQYADLMAGKVDLGATSPFASTANALEQQVMGRLKGNILPGLRQQQVQYQPGGSSRAALAQNKAITGAVQQGLTKPMADMYSQAYQQAQAQRLPAAQMGLGAQQFGMGYGLQGLGAQQASMGQYPSIMGAPLGMYKAMGDVGAARRGLSQSVIDRDMQRYNYEQMAPYNALNQYMNTISGNYGGTTTQTTPNSGMMQMLGSLGSAAILASDARVKENIVRDGTIKGHAAYRFNYLGDSTPRRGVIAQEVEKTNPGAVAEFGGIKHVNYGAL